jgi:tetratricopeptide (TPR) repeat protein
MFKTFGISVIIAAALASAGVFAAEGLQENEKVRALIEKLLGDNLKAQIDAEKELIALGAEALPDLLEAEASAKEQNLAVLRRVRRAAGYGLTPALSNDLAQALGELESRIKGRDYDALKAAMDNADGQVAGLARGIVKKISEYYTGMLSADEADLQRARAHFLSSPREAAITLKNALKTLPGPSVARAREILEEIVSRAVKSLSDAVPEKREKAEEVLFEAGQFALESLKRAAAGSDADLAHRAKRLLIMIDFSVSPALYERIGHILADYDTAPWRKRRDYVIEIERLCQVLAKPVLMAVVVREKDQNVKETAGAALLRTVLMGAGDLSIVKFLEENGVINPKSIPAITIEIYKDQANKYFGKKDYKSALAELEKAYAIESTDEAVLYNIACCHSMLGDPDRAIVFLKKAVAAGFADWRHMNRDKDMDPLRGDPRFKEIIEGLKAQDRTRDPAGDKDDEGKPKDSPPPDGDGRGPGGGK